MTVCDFCKGRPVLNAAAWTSATERKYAVCPRCGADPYEHHCSSCGVELTENESGRCSVCWQRETSAA